MAKIITLGALINKITGSIDKVTYIDGKQGKILRKKLQRTDPQTEGQQMQRDAFLFTCRMWNVITPAMQNSFSNFSFDSAISGYNNFQAHTSSEL